MSLLKNLLGEAKKTQVATKPDVKMNDIFDDDFHSPAKSQDKSVAGKKRQAKKISAAASRADAAAMPTINHHALNDLADHEDMRNAHHDRHDPQPPTDDTALATTTKEVRGAGKIHADWMNVDQLPGYMQHGIRAMGRIVFKPLTRTDLEDINILANLGGHGPNEAIEMNAVANFARKHAKETRDLSMNFGEMIPGYHPEVKLYITPHDTYLVVQDDMGRYIYSWESKNTKEAFIKQIK
jgi:hypothetical protein